MGVTKRTGGRKRQSVKRRKCVGQWTRKRMSETKQKEILTK